MAKKRTIAKADNSRKRNERAAMLLSRVMSGSFLSARTPHGLDEVGIRDHAFSASFSASFVGSFVGRFAREDWIVCQGCYVLRTQHDPAFRVHREPAQGSGHRAGESQLARRIQK